MNSDKDYTARWVVGGIFVLVVLIVGGWLLSIALADPTGRADAYKKVHGDGTYRNATTSKFFDACASIQASEGRIDLAKTTLKQDLKSGADADTIRRDRENIAGPSGQRLEMINQYNADADNTQVVGFLRDSRLPIHIYPEQEHTRCAS